MTRQRQDYSGCTGRGVAYNVAKEYHRRGSSPPAWITQVEGYFLKYPNSPSEEEKEDWPVILQQEVGHTQNITVATPGPR